VVDLSFVYHLGVSKMAKQEHLTLLKQGVADWNHWRRANPEIELDLTTANLSNADLCWARLSRANLKEADLSRADLNGADLKEADFSGANLSEAMLVADLSGANLSKANLRNANLIEARLDKVNLTDADLYGANFSRTNLREANLIGADLSNANFLWADLSNAKLNPQDFTKANFTAAILSGTDLSKEKLKHIKQIDLFMAQLPSVSLLEYTQTPDMFFHAWLAMNESSKSIGKSLKARLASNNGKLTFRDMTSRSSHEVSEVFDENIIRVFTDYNVALFQIIQIGWSYIQHGFSQLSDECPESEVALFFKILQERYDGMFVASLLGFRHSIGKESQERLKRMRDIIWRNACNSDWCGEFPPELLEEIRISIARSGIKIAGFYWLSLSIRICQDAAKMDSKLRSKLQKFRDIEARGYDLFAKAGRKRESATWKKQHSYKFENGRFYRGVRGGYQPLYKSGDN
jgi:uncharacterized protein YjbI with pentapeptide repeats